MKLVPVVTGLVFLLAVRLETLAVSYNIHAPTSRTSCSPAQQRLQQQRRLALRGGVWYDGEEEDDSGSYYYTDEDDDSGYNPLETQAPDWVRRMEPEPNVVRANEGLTEEEVQTHPELVPVGGWNDGFFPEFQGKNQETYRRDHNLTDFIPYERMRPQRLRDVYGMGKYVMNSSESPYTEEFYEKPRNILRVPPDQLPREFHLRVDPTLNVPTQFSGTLAEKFSEWFGPVPDSWSAVVYDDNGPVFVYSVGFDEPIRHPELVQELGGEQAVQFFYDATAENVEAGRVSYDTLGYFEPGPSILDELLPSSRAPGVEMFRHPPAKGELQDVFVPDNVSFVYRAVAAVEAGQRLVCRRGVHKWGRGSEAYPRWELRINQSNAPLHVRGELRVKAKPVQHEHINCSKLSDRWEEMLGTRLYGQWCVFDGSCGSFSNVFMGYESVFRQTLIRIFSGPWLIDNCCLKSSHIICVLASCNSHLQATNSFIGGTGPEIRYHHTLPGLAYYGVAMIANSNVSLSNCVLEDIGFEGGCAIALNDRAEVFVHNCEFNRCRLAVHMGHFAHAEFDSCLIHDSKDAAFWSEVEHIAILYPTDHDLKVYYPVPEENQEEFDRIVESEMYYEDDKGNLFSSLKPEDNPDGTFFNDPNSTFAMMVIKNCTVHGSVWNTDSRPFTFICDQEELK